MVIQGLMLVIAVGIFATLGGSRLWSFSLFLTVAIMCTLSGICLQLSVDYLI